MCECGTIVSEAQVDNNEQNTQNAAQSDSAKSRFSQSLNDYAARITSVRNDIYTTQWWQFLINFALGGGALGLLLASMFTKGNVMLWTAVGGIVLVVGVIVFNIVMRSFVPTSFLQYTYVDREKNKTYCFRILSKTRATYFDGETTIESNRDVAAKLDAPIFTEYRYDFFADIDPTERITDGEKETYKGVLSDNGKTYKCKMVFKNGVPLYGSIGGTRIKYFDVNKTKDKFVVPVELKRAAKLLNVPFPKVPGLYVRDDVKDYSKQ